MGPDTFLLLMTAAVMWLTGFTTCGAMIGRTPFWDGVRDVLTFGLWRRNKNRGWWLS